MFKREDEEGWAAIVQDMAARGARGTQQELNVITEYLAAHFNRSQGFKPLMVAGTREAETAASTEELSAAGQQIYGALCASCHGSDGRGREKIAPSLVGSGLVIGPSGIPVRIMLHGKRGPANVMPALGRFMVDAQIAAALTYIRQAWGHTAGPIDSRTVKDIRERTSGRARPWSAEELQDAVAGERGPALQN
jgi:mono/diheme cytochrome c family protein